MQISITGNQLDLTEAIKSYVEKKIGGLDKFYENISEAKVVLGKETNHHNKGEIFFVECRLYVPGKDLFAKNNAKDLYAAIDIVRDELGGELKKHKEKNKSISKKQHGEAREIKEYQDSDEEVES